MNDLKTTRSNSDFGTSKFNQIEYRSEIVVLTRKLWKEKHFGKHSCYGNLNVEAFVWQK